MLEEASSSVRTAWLVGVAWPPIRPQFTKNSSIMTLKEFCKKYGLTEAQATGGEEIGYLYLSSVTSIPEGFNPTVGGDLDLSSGSKYIGAKVEIPYIPARYLWRNKEYIKVDGIFTKIISERGNVMRVQRIARKEIEYLVTDGDGRWAHGATLKEAKESLIYKITSRDTTKYKSWSLSTEITHAEAIEAYRTITGACSFGTRYFCEMILGDNKKDKYTVSEVIELTKGQYGADSFKAFFS